MEMGLLYDFLGICSTWGEKYYFRMEESMQDEIEPMRGEIEHEMNIPARGQHGPDGVLGSRGQSGGHGGGGGSGAPIWYAISPIWYAIPYLVYHLSYPVFHPINESPKWNSSLLDISFIDPPMILSPVTTVSSPRISVLHEPTVKPLLEPIYI